MTRRLLKGIRILSDISALQTRPAHDGLGRYWRATMRALQEIAGDGLEHILVANGHLGTPGDIPFKHHGAWRLYYADYPVHEHSPSAWHAALEPYQAYWQALLDCLKPDIVHIYAPFDWRLPLHSLGDSKPIVVTVHDLCPFQLQAAFQQQAPDWEIAASRHAAQWLKGAAALMATSAEIRHTLIDQFGIREDRVHLAEAAPTPGTAAQGSPGVARLLRRYGIQGRYMLCVTSPDLRGNLINILKSYARLSGAQRCRYPLVVLCALSLEEEWFYYHQLAEWGIDGDIAFVPAPSASEMTALLQGASLLYSALAYDQLGNNILDAQAMGVPVVASQTAPARLLSTVPWIVDPGDVADVATTLSQALDQLDEQGDKRGAPLTASHCWKDTARVQLDVYHQIVSSERGKGRPAASRLSPHPLKRLALVSPLPPERTGVADFSVELAHAIQKQVDVTAYVAPESLAQVDGGLHLEARSIAQLEGDVVSGYVDALLYQIGNSKFHLYELPYLERVPGIVEIHDGILHNLFAELTLPHRDGEGYLRELSYAHGQEGRDLATDVLAGQLPGELGRLTVNRRVINWALGTIVHNAWAARAVEAQCTNQPVLASPLPISEQESMAALDRSAARERLGIPQDALVLATFGRLTPAKRLATIVRAFARLGKDIPKARLYLVGSLEGASDARRIPDLVEELGIGEHVNMPGHIERQEFLDHMAATDIGLNLRYPHAGETSATLTLLLNAGLPVITSNVGPFVDLPDDCCWKVDVDDSEEDLLLAYLARLGSDEALRHTMSANARRFVKKTIPTWEQAAERYLEFIEGCRPQLI